MGFRINTNVAALNAHRNSVMNNLALNQNLTRLSSGLRINKAADDASGLAIADSLNSQATGLGQAIRNANDGINLAQTADGALQEYSNIINTVRTKAIQAASDGQNADSRAAIQRDIDKLLKEAQNIASTTTFNGQTLLNGGYKDKSFHIGAYTGETVNITINDTQIAKVGKFALSDGTAAISSGGISGTLTVTNADGVSVSVSWTKAQTTGNTKLENAQMIVDKFNAASQTAGANIHASVFEDKDNPGTYKIRLDSVKSYTVSSTGGTGLSNGTANLTNNLGTIDVTTKFGAEKAIAIAKYALRDIDETRSNIGSVQNQLESTVRNISVTEVNVTAARSTIMDVDFAAESASFAKHNILAQSGSYAMSQANAVQQNVLRLLQ